MTMKWLGNKLELKGKTVEFSYEIEQVISWNDTFLVLVNIPEDSDEINNIFCISEDGEQLWRAEDLNVVREGLLHLPYEAMEMKDDKLYAADFYGRYYTLDPKNGKILEYSLKK